MVGWLRVLTGLAVVCGCVGENTGTPPAMPACDTGGVIDQAPTTSMFDQISLTGTANLGNCTDGMDQAVVTVTNVTTGAAGSGHASAPYCAAFLREYDVSASAPLQPGPNSLRVRVEAGTWHRCEMVDVECAPCSPPP
jgi:hypothetical protein